LLVTADGGLLDDLLRLAATAGVEVDVAHDVGTARRYWSAASLVLVGQDLVARCAAARLVRRPRLILVGNDLDDASVWQQAVEVGAEQVALLPDAEGWLIAALDDAVEGGGRDGVLVAVLGGRGGAGATTLACALALTAVRRGLRTLLVDADPLGGGIDLVFGGELTPGLRWPDLVSTRGRLAAQALSDALPRFDDLPVLSWDRGEVTSVPVEAMAAVLGAARRSCELTVVDLPRSFDECTVEVLSTASTTLVVVPAEVRATASAGRVATRSALLCSDLRLVVRGPSPVDLRPADLARALNLPLAFEVRAEPGLGAALDRGEPPTARSRSPLAAACNDLLDTLTGSATSRAA